MIHHRNVAEVRRFDLLKLMVLIILLLLLLWFWLAPPSFLAGNEAEGNSAAETAVSTTEITDALASLDAAIDESTIADELNSVSAPLTLTGLENGSTLLAGPLALTGRGAPGTTVRVVLDGTEMGTVTVGTDGAWSLDLVVSEGEHVFVLEGLDANGAIATAVEPVAFTASATTGEQPIPALPSFNPLGVGMFAGRHTLSGLGEPDREVELLLDGRVVGMTTVGADGVWSLALDLPPGEHQLALRVVEGGVETAPVTFSLVQLTPPTLSIPDEPFVAGENLLSGTGTPGTTVEILLDGDVAGTAVVDADGAWSLPYRLASGEYALGVRMFTGEGTVMESEAALVNIARPPAVIDAPGDGVQVPAGDLMLSGTAEPGGEVEVVVDGALAASVVADEDGRWSVAITPTAGSREIGARYVGGEESSSVNITVAAPVVEETVVDVSANVLAALDAICADPQPGIDQGATYVVGECEWLTLIAKRLAIPYEELRAVNLQIADPNTIYPGQVINLPPR
jgi:hypothetical protein